MMNQVGSSRVDTVLKMLLIAFISLLAFSSGVYFGKQLVVSDYKLKELESDFNHSAKVAEHGKDLDVQPEDALVDEEVSAMSDKFVNAEREELGEGEGGGTQGKAEENRRVASEGHGEAAGHGAPAPAAKAQAGHGAAANEHEAPAAGHGAPAAKTAAAAKPDLSAAHNAAKRIASNSAPIEAPAKATVESTRNPTALPKVVGGSGVVEFTVQVASYPTADAAKEHANELVKKGFPAFPVEAAVNGRTWYRVSVGSFKSMREATSYRAQLLKQADVQSAIVQRIQR